MTEIKPKHWDFKHELNLQIFLYKYTFPHNLTTSTLKKKNTSNKFTRDPKLIYSTKLKC